jgi:maltooligosyltrehalose synthase
VRHLAQTWKDGRIKMRLIRSLLRHRREQPSLYQRGSYVPLNVSGPQASRFVAFQRRDSDHRLFVVALRRMERDGVSAIREICDGSALSLPEAAPAWRDILTGREIKSGAAELPLAELLDVLPVAIFAA